MEKRLELSMARRASAITRKISRSSLVAGSPFLFKKDITFAFLDQGLSEQDSFLFEGCPTFFDKRFARYTVAEMVGQFQSVQGA